MIMEPYYLTVNERLRLHKDFDFYSKAHLILRLDQYIRTQCEMLQQKPTTKSTWNILNPSEPNTPFKHAAENKAQINEVHISKSKCGSKHSIRRK